MQIACQLVAHAHAKKTPVIHPRNFSCDSSGRPARTPLGGREGNQVSARRGEEFVVFCWRKIVQEMEWPLSSRSKTCLLGKLFLFQVFHGIRIL